MLRGWTFTLAAALTALLTGGCASPAVTVATVGFMAESGDFSRLVADATGRARPQYHTAVIEPQEEIPPPALLPPTPERLPAAQAPLSPSDAATASEFDQDIRPIGELSTDISVPATLDQTGEPVDLPPDYASAALAAQPAFTRGTAYDPVAHSALPHAPGLEFCYQPLFFEEVNVERYGRSLGRLQPALSIVQFYGRMPALPYMVVARRARTCSYHAHWTLPGYKAPFEHPEPIVRADAGLAETAFVYGMILLIP